MQKKCLTKAQIVALSHSLHMIIEMIKIHTAFAIIDGSAPKRKHALMRKTNVANKPE